MTIAKSYEISKRVVWEAYKRVKSNRGAAGVNGESLTAFEENATIFVYKCQRSFHNNGY